MNIEKNKVLKLSTSGSVDDGKSTLIGRILYDTKSLKEDKLAAIEESSRKKGYDYLDFSLATDGLVAEREQGITIDVAHIYFSTPNRSYIIADTPGHKEYTRNMITGASTSQVAIILIDARNGVVEQTRRHFFITNLLRTKEIIVAINKMDLVGYKQEMFDRIKSDFEKLMQSSAYKEQRVTFVPISALHGDNVLHKSKQMDWYSGESLMDYLEHIDIEDLRENAQARFQIQTVIRPKTEEYHDFRGYGGKLEGGEFRVGDEVCILPSERKSKIKTIELFDKKFTSASEGSSITITLEDDVNVSRGDMIVKADEMPKQAKKVLATICWMNDKALTPNSMFYLQHGVNVLKVKVKSVIHKISVDAYGKGEQADELNMNDLGYVEIQFSKPFYYDSYKVNKENGAFILIDPNSNTTAGVGFID